jgi:hypothetical protein
VDTVLEGGIETYKRSVHDGRSLDVDDATRDRLEELGYL